MCVISYKAAKAALPTEQTIAAMWRTNPDGGGAMWRNPKTGEVGFQKGFMDLADFQKFIDKNRKKWKTWEVALHFRIGTHGGNTPQNTHPFIVDIGADPHTMSGEDVQVPVLMHNGVFHIKPRRVDISDTAELCLRAGKYPSPLTFLADISEQLAGNRVIVFDKTGVHFYGDEFQDGGDGLLYSNLHHVVRKSFGFGTTSWSGSASWWTPDSDPWDDDCTGGKKKKTGKGKRKTFDYQKWVDSIPVPIWLGANTSMERRLAREAIALTIDDYGPGSDVQPGDPPYFITDFADAYSDEVTETYLSLLYDAQTKNAEEEIDPASLPA